jgi:hypothetical protein
MHTKNEEELKIFISNFAHFSHALALKYIYTVTWLGTGQKKARTSRHVTLRIG